LKGDTKTRKAHWRQHEKGQKWSGTLTRSGYKMDSGQCRHKSQSHGNSVNKAEASPDSRQEWSRALPHSGFSLASSQNSPCSKKVKQSQTEQLIW